MGRSHIVARHLGFGMVRTVIPHAGIPHGQRSLQVPVRAQIPRVSVSDAGSGRPAFVMVLPERGKNIERQFEAAHRILAGERLDHQESARVFAAEPVAVLGHREKVLDLSPAADRPGVPADGKPQGRPVAHGHVDAGIQAGRSPIEHIGLHGHALTVGHRSGSDHRNAQKQEFFNHNQLSEYRLGVRPQQHCIRPHYNSQNVSEA